MMSASDRRRLAAHGAGLSTCPSSGPSARIAPAAIWTDRGCGFRGSGTDPDAQHLARHVRHRPGPDVPFAAAVAAMRKRLPARWLALRGRSRPPASGAPMASASFRDLPHVTQDPERPSSRLVRHVRDPSGSGSTESVARGRRVGTKSGVGFWVRGWDCWGWGGGVCTVVPTDSVIPALNRDPAGERP